MDPRLHDILERVRRGELTPQDGARLVAQPGAGASGAPARRVDAQGPQADPSIDAVACDYVLTALVDVFQLPRDRVRVEASFGSLGIDSRGFVALLQYMQAHLGTLPKTLLFEYPTAAHLAAHLAAHHRDALTRWRSAASATAAAESPSAPTPAPAVALAPATSSPIVASAPGPDLASPRPTATDVRDSEVSSATRPASEPVASTDAEPMRIAIVGIAGRFPLADDLDAFWANLAAGRNCVTDVPRERWDSSVSYDPHSGRPGTSCGKWGGFLSRVDAFDYEFFGIAPREAALMMPEERLLLETAWEVFEQAGYTRARLTDTQRARHGVGVFVGCMHQHYRDLAARPEEAALLSTSSYWGLANRLSYTFDLRGPSLAIDTACASALTAVHMACESLRRGECGMALAGAVNLTLHASKYISLTQIGMLSTGAESRGLGIADGIIPGEGVGAVLLKPLDAARADGDHIHAIVLGSAASHGGAAGSYTAINPDALARTIDTAIRAARIEPETINYLELAANGSPMADVLELGATADAVARRRAVATPCAIGTVKSNIGHLEAASGLSQLAKVVLQMRHRLLAPTIHCDPPNPDLPLARSGFHIQRTLSTWDPVTVNGEPLPRRAGITSVGAGGSYAHVIVEEAIDARAQETSDDNPQVLTLSAKTPERLAALVPRVAAWLRPHEDCDLRDVAYTLQVGREAFGERLAVVAINVREALGILDRWPRAGAGRDVIQGPSHGRVRLPHADANPAIPDRLSHADPRALAALWVEGHEINWHDQHRHRQPRMLPLPTSPFERTRAWITERTPSSPDAVRSSDASPQAVRPSRATVSGARGLDDDATRARIASLAAEVLGVAPSELDDRGFVTLGMTSVGAVHLVRAINREFGLTLKTTALFECATAADLARLVVARAPGSVRDSRDSDVGGAETSDQAPDRAHHYAVCLGEPQLLAGVRLTRIEPRAPAAGEVRIDVRAFSLNFGDLLCVQGLYPTQPDYPFTPGFEVAGVVRDVGAGVTRVAAGDEVIALTGAAMGGHATSVTVPDALVVRKPASVSFEDAAAFPVVYLTMRHAFEVGQVKAGDRVLIQTAAGGLGLIGVQLARQIGADVIATAGSARKLEYLRGRGVEHVINYREEDFAARTRAMTGVRGVDVIFNTLAGDALQKSLPLLAPGGRYVEMAMTGLQTSGPVDLSCLSSNQSIHCVDMRRLGGERPALLRDHLERMADALAAGDVQPTVDRTFDLSRVHEAYAYVAGAQNIGKVIVTVPPRLSSDATIERRTPAIHARAETRTGVREPIAVIGMSGRFPGAEDVESFWEMLRAGRSAIREVPPERWDWRPYFAADRGRRAPIYTRWGGFLDGIDAFDALFFRMSGREATFTDPQQRLFLEECWRALEDAGLARLAADGVRTGVFAGAAAGDYHLRLAAIDPEPQAFWGNSASLIPARINYLLNLTGPSVAVDTACSSSLVAVHLACQSLWSGECDVALAGGVYVGTTPGLFLAGCSASMLAPDDRCKAFDDRADGFVAGEAVAAVVLKPVSAAERDGDRIHAVILGSGTNQDGRTYGITVPSARAQAALERMVYEQAGVNPRSIGMIEAHGTGTRLGDPVEVDALTDAFRHGTGDRQFCALGSVKTNIGHAAAGAGIAGFIKAVLALQHAAIPPSLHFDRPNTQIPFETTPFFVNTALRPWTGADGPRRAAVSSFGFSGTNAHVLLQEYRLPERAPEAPALAIVPLSARDPRALTDMARRLAALVRSTNPRLADVARTLQRGREEMEERLAIVASTPGELADALERFANGAGGGVRGRAERREGTASTLAERVDGTTASPGAATPDALERLASAWVRGARIDWDALPRARDARMMSLPSYPFARDRHWIDAPPAASAAAVAMRRASATVDAAASAESRAGEDDLVSLRPVWRPATVSRTTDEAHDPYVLIDASRGPAALDDFEAAVGGRAAIVLWPDATDIERVWNEPFDAAIARGLGLAARVFQVVAARGAGRPFRLVLAAREVAGLIDPFVDAVSAFVPSMRQVLPRLSATFVSVDGESLRDLTDRAIAELTTADVADRVRYSQGVRSVSGLERVPDDPAAACPIKAGGVYVISGGLGKLGRLLGRHLTAAHGAHAVLIGQPRSGAARERRFETIGESGVELVSCAANVVRVDEVAQALDAVRGRYGRIDGVFHLAGVHGSTPLLQKGARDIALTVAAKMAGAIALDRGTRNDALDFFAMFSSTSSWLGDFGSGDYAASNRFLDAYAALRESERRRGRCQGRTVSLGWSMWRSGGMHGDADAAELFMRTSGFRYIESAEGLIALERRLAHADPHALIVGATPQRIDWLLGTSPRNVAAVEPPSEPTLPPPTPPPSPASTASASAPQPPSSLSSLAAPAASAGDMSIRPALEADLRGVVGGLLRLDAARLDPTENLGNFGFDSLTLSELAEQLSARYSVDVSAQTFYSATTIARIAAYLLDRHPGEIDRYLRPTSPPEPPSSAPPSSSPPVAARPAADTATDDAGDTAGVAVDGAIASDELSSDRVAVIGMAGLLPGSRDIWDFWTHVEAGDDLIARREQRWGGFIDGVEYFDAAFFNISRREAELMDPQQRLLLQVVLSALEDAGRPMARVAGRRVGVFVGIEQSDYAQRVWRASPGYDAHATAGTHLAFAANRVSHVFDLRGPSEAVNAGCASATLAIHRAVESLARGECDLAIAAGTNILLNEDGYDIVSQFGALSVDGAVRVFAKGSTGSVRAEGIGAVILSPFAAAVTAGDRIHAVIAGSAVAHGGRGQSVAAPNPDAQAEAIRRACARAGVEPRSLSYIEAQATGSELGDAIELSGYQDAFGVRGSTTSESPCAIGALKPVCGHLEAASGIAALIKVVLALKHRAIPVLKHAAAAAPLPGIAAGGFHLPERSTPWEPGRDADGRARARRAGILSYGLGGACVHLVVEEAPEQPSVRRATADADVIQPQIVVLSARTAGQLRQRAADLRAFLDRPRTHDGEWELADIAFTLQLGRDAMRERLAIVAASVDELKARLDGVVGGDLGGHAGVHRGSVSIGVTSHAAAATASSADGADAAMAARDLDRIASLWSAGVDVDWSTLPRARQPRLVSLPTYPFARERYWLDDIPTERASAVSYRSNDGIAASAPGNGDRGSSDRNGGDRINGDHGGDDTIAWLRDVVAERLKVEPDSLSVDRPFRDYGLDSLLSTQVMQLIQTRYGRGIPFSATTEHPTLRRLASHLDASAVAVAPLQGKATRANGGRHGDGGALDSLLAINARGSRAPSFWVHGAPGTGELYNKLSAALGPDYPLYAFQARGVDGQKQPFTTLVDMAAHYVDAILAVRASGPYFIGGYSSGGLIAYEIAQQLTHRGLQVGRLIVLDTYPPAMLKAFGRTRSARKRHLQRVMGAILFFAAENRIDLWDHLAIDDLKAIPESAPIAHLARLVKRRLPTPLPEDHVFRVLSGVDTVLALNDDMCRGYRLRPYDGSDVLFFKTRELIDPKSPYGIPGLDIEDLGFTLDTLAQVAAFPYLDLWKASIRQRLDVVPCTCDHLSLFDEPHVQAVRQKIASSLEVPAVKPVKRRGSRQDRGPRHPSTVHETQRKAASDEQ